MRSRSSLKRSEIRHYKRSTTKDKIIQIEPSIHRRILNFLNDPVWPEDLVYEKITNIHPDGNPVHQDNLVGIPEKPKKILDLQIAKQVIDFRDRDYPLGFRNIKELSAIRQFSHRHLDHLLSHFSEFFYGRWDAFPIPIPRRGPGGYDGVVHAALLHTGKVLFITADETTILWDPENTSPTTFEDPVNNLAVPCVETILRFLWVPICLVHVLKGKKINSEAIVLYIFFL